MSPTRRALRLQFTLALVFAAVCAIGAGTGAWGSEGGPAPAAPRSGHVGDAASQAVGDRWTADYTPEQFAAYSEALDGHYVGVGLWLARSPQGAVTVTRTLPGSPAAHARLAAGDRLLEIDGTRVDGRPVTQVVALLRGGAAGKVGSEVTLLLQRGTQQWAVALRRAVLDEDDVRVDHPEAGVTRISMDAFTVGVSEQVQAAVRQARLHPDRGGRGILLDLRGNSGGLVAEAVATASVFLDGGPVARYRPVDGGPEQTLTAAPGGDTATPLVVLVDGGTMSAAELVTGALRDRGRAVVVGGPTFGKGAVQAPQALSDGVVQEHTVGHYLTPSGTSPDGQGIQPDIAVPPDASAQTAEDTALTVLDDLSGGDGQ
ncbi:S41 family peptidase [Streptacidiphilus jiangxiensis]|uniref:Carboxyl-terminal processing protease n=1 Tax=Streptacidiphilus jiangxiensis TaxID=235985 RepID=A0A1H7RNT5_STRJI|nr:S41 family peptidase [Streptacidiphilus jiangxiensis]SEL61822.1 carboxyl-terminal processing protease [Streptacidiphilus jiangxiensis]